MGLSYCPECLVKQRRIDDLEEEIILLKARLRYQERAAAEGPFGSSTPSSKIPLKAGASPERKERVGGAKQGHVGHGRRAFSPEDADMVVFVAAPRLCPGCGSLLEAKGMRDRTVLDCAPVKVVKALLRIERKRCPNCGKVAQGRPEGVLPKSKYGNGLLAHAAIEHYVHGVTLGRLSEQTGVGLGGLIEAMHSLSRRLKDVPDRLIEQYRHAPVKHADETGWRNDGESGYAWLFCTEDLSIFRIRKSRSASVVREVLGDKKLKGVLVVDRYGAYNKAPCETQYCYAHLLRDVEDLQKDFPDDDEVASFVQTFEPLLSSAISLRGLDLPERQFRLRAAQIKKKIIRAANTSARHPAIQRIQDIFRQKAGRLYHWARAPAIPADNNLAERELRPLVIARKISFGSQSDRGAKTREILMTALRTLKKRARDPYFALKSCLDELARTPDADPFMLLFTTTSKSPRN